MKTKTVLMCVLAVVVAAGCATFSRGPCDEEQIAAVVQNWEEALLAKDVNALMALYSESFAHSGFDYKADDKAAMRGFIENSDAMGYLDGIAVAYEPDAIAVDGNTAEVYPIDFVNNEGAVVVSMVLKKESVGWLITDMEVQGL